MAAYDAHLTSALADTERRLAATQTLARVGDWALERDTGHMLWSPELFRLFERPIEQGVPDINEALAYFSPESLELTRTAFWYAIDKGERCTLEQTAQLPSGTTAHYVTEIVPVADDTGRVFMLYGTVQDITERKALEAERLRQVRRVAELSRRLLEVGEHERRRLAAALHDQASPNLAALKLIFTNLRKALPDSIHRELEPLLDDAAALLADTDAGIRDICATLHPATLDYAGLAAAIREYAKLVARHSDTRVLLELDEDMSGLSAELQAMLFRIAQEALTNCAKHASAHRIRIELRRRGKDIVLRIADDGCGFDPELLGQHGTTPGLGLITMRERAELAGGRFTLRSAPDAGTEIEVVLAPHAHRFPGGRP
ncbi:PAS domain-containing sensor histidine kinase [Thauera sp. SDU_THAU2]|uniref:PAS domain-containing sensor histidine kinase n=1 Tax=Thauera sp. SDU_THAU2 TaxID=3136633 RepID=UPI00311EAA23